MIYKRSVPSCTVDGLCSQFHICRNIWFEAATVVAVPPPVEISTGNVLKSALAGGLACALSTSIMHPIDTMKVTVSTYLIAQVY